MYSMKMLDNISQGRMTRKSPVNATKEKHPRAAKSAPSTIDPATSFVKYSLSPIFSPPHENNHKLTSDPLLELLGESREAAKTQSLALPELPQHNLLASQRSRGVKRPRRQASSKVRPSSDMPTNLVTDIKMFGNLSMVHVHGNAKCVTPQKNSQYESMTLSTREPLQSHVWNLDERFSIANHSEDELACHADNIMRMAVDSTMLGSTFDSSYLNTFANDSCFGNFESFADLALDGSYCDRSVIEGARARRSRQLETSRVQKVEINADDLAAAIS